MQLLPLDGILLVGLGAPVIDFSRENSLVPVNSGDVKVNNCLGGETSSCFDSKVVVNTSTDKGRLEKNIQIITYLPLLGILFSNHC